MMRAWATSEVLAIASVMREVIGRAALCGHRGLWLSLVERLVRDEEAVGSNPTSPIPACEIALHLLEK